MIIKGSYLQVVKLLSLLFLILVLLSGESFALNRVAVIHLDGAVKNLTPGKVTVAELEKLPQTTYVTFNPYEKKRFTYTGVLLKDLVTAYAAPDCVALTVTARDEYQVTFFREEWLRWDILLATRTDGKTMSIRDSGPAKIVMPYDTVQNVDFDEYTPKWIWLIKSIHFKAAI